MSTPNIIAEDALAVQENFGVVFAGTFVSMILFGIVIAQLFIYFTRYSRDALWLKGFVVFLFLCDLCSTIFIIWWMYYLFVDNWGNVVVFSQGNWMIASDPLILGVMACATHFFFARRIKIITKNTWLALLICLFGLGTLAGALGGTIDFMRLKDFSELSSMKPIAIVWLLSAALGDVVITFSISWYLQSHKSGFKQTDQLVDKVILVTVQNGLVTATVATAALILYLVSPRPYHLALSLILPKMYTNTILSSLNYRDQDRHGQTSVNPSEIVASALRRNPEVMVHVEAHEMVDTVKTDVDWDAPGKDRSV